MCELPSAGDKFKGSGLDLVRWCVCRDEAEWCAPSWKE